MQTNDWEKKTQSESENFDSEQLKISPIVRENVHFWIQQALFLSILVKFVVDLCLPDLPKPLLSHIILLNICQKAKVCQTILYYLYKRRKNFLWWREFINIKLKSKLCLLIILLKVTYCHVCFTVFFIIKQ